MSWVWALSRSTAQAIRCIIRSAHSTADAGPDAVEGGVNSFAATAQACQGNKATPLGSVDELARTETPGRLSPFSPIRNLMMLALMLASG